MKKDKFPSKLFITCDGDSTDGYYPLAFEEVPEQDGDKVAVYEKIGEGKIIVTTTVVEVSSARTAKK